MVIVQRARGNSAETNPQLKPFFLDFTTLKKISSAWIITYDEVRSKGCKWHKTCFEKLDFEVVSAIFLSRQIVWGPRKQSNLLRIMFYFVGWKIHLKIQLES